MSDYEQRLLSWKPGDDPVYFERDYRTRPRDLWNNTAVPFKGVQVNITGGPMDWTKPLKTRSGLPVRVLCTDRRGFAELEIVVLIDEGGKEVLCSVLRDGTGAIQGNADWHIINA